MNAPISEPVMKGQGWGMRTDLNLTGPTDLGSLTQTEWFRMREQ